MNMVENVDGLSGIDALLVRLNAALTDYGRSVGQTKKSYPIVDHHLHEAVRHVLEFGLKVHLNLSLPDPLDRIWKGDMREYCRTAWETFDKDPLKISHLTVASMIFAEPFKRLIFRKRSR